MNSVRRWDEENENEKTSPVFVLSGVVGGAFLGWGGGGREKAILVFFLFFFFFGTVCGSR